MTPILRAFSDARYRVVVGVMGAQMGKTEAIFNIIGHRFDDGPYMPALYIGPTEKQVRSVSGDRIYKMLKTTPALWDKLARGHKDKVTEKWIGGVRLGFGWAGSATELSTHPAGLVLIDERDRMDDDVGREGDPFILAGARTKTYPNAKVGVFSTPTIEGASAIWSLYEEGTLGKWSVPCPECEVYFVPRLELLKWAEKATPQIAHETAHLVCPECGSVIESERKNELNAAGRYQFHELNEAGEHIPTESERPNRTASFWVSGIMSPWQSFGDVAELLVAAYRSGEPERIQAGVNTYAGELYKTRGDAPAWTEVSALRQPYQARSVPVGVQIITLGVDVQKLGLYYVVRGWGFNSESWLLDHGFVAGETEFDNVWILLSRMLDAGYLADGRTLDRVFIDSGYRPGDKLRRPEHQVYKFARQHPGLVYPTKGHDTLDRACKMSRVDMSIQGKVIKGGVKLWHLNTDYYKSLLYSRIRWPQGEPGGFHLFEGADEDYCRQIVAEELVTKASGKRTWVRRSRDNHYLDCEVNAYAAAETLQVQTLKPLDPEPAKPKPGSSHNPDGFVKRPPGGFIRR